MRTFIKELWDLWVERRKIHKALRILNKQEWSIEFLTALLVRAANFTHQPLEMFIRSANGHEIVVRTADVSTPYADDDIFDHLDDELKIKAFMDKVR
jgi:hypothetical protein